MKKENEMARTGCEGPQAHDDHLCRLMERGLAAEIDRLTCEANFTCRNCGAYASQAECLCNPEPL